MGTVHAKSFDGATDIGAVGPSGSADKASDGQDILLDGIRARVDRIHVDGLSRTKNDIVEDCIRDVLKATDFQDVLMKAHRARVKLSELDCFKTIGVYIDTSKGKHATPDGLEVTFNVKEHKRVTGDLHTHIGNDEAGGGVTVKLPNLFGRGERIQTDFSYGSKKTSSFNVGFYKPLRGKHRPMISTILFQGNSEWTTSGYKLLNRGLIFDFSFYSLPVIKHSLQWEAAIRDLSVLSRNTSFEVREQSGLSLKSALRHIAVIDRRDETIFPTAGSFLRLTSEVAGLGGDVGYFKNEVFLQANYSLAEDIVVQGCVSGGFVRGVSNSMKIGMPDLCYLGGPLNVRGFQLRGVGPHSEGDATGATAFWATGLHLFTPLPFRPGRGGFGDLFRVHLFVTCGNAANFNFGNGQDIVQELTSNMRISFGAGLALKVFNFGRFEINYCIPKAYEKGDKIQPGVQFGLGVEFL